MVDNALTGYEIKKYFNGRCKIITYDELNKYSSINQLLYPYNKVVILYVFKKNNGVPYGHWICVFKNINKNIEVFDSLGNFVDDFLNKIDIKFRENNGEYFKYLSNLLINYDGNVEYNNKKLQGDNSKTCGKWCVLRMIRKDLTIEKFNKLFSKNTYKNDNMILELF